MNDEQNKKLETYCVVMFVIVNIAAVARSIAYMPGDVILSYSVVKACVGTMLVVDLIFGFVYFILCGNLWD